jgi:TonB family protein
VAGFPGQPGRAVETCPILLAPDYGAARHATLEDGDDVDVLLADHDFYGVRLPGKILAFVPARAIRLLPAPVPTAGRSKAGKDAVVPSITPLGGPQPAQAAEAGASPSSAPTPASAAARSPGPAEPLGALPSGAEPPVLVTRVDARYPDVARRMNLSAEVVLRVVVEPTGSVGKVEVVSGGPAGMTDAAIDAVKRWVYRPARVDGRAVAVTKIVRVRFSPVPVREPPAD